MENAKVDDKTKADKKKSGKIKSFHNNNEIDSQLNSESQIQKEAKNESKQFLIK